MAAVTPKDLGARSVLAIDKHAAYIQSFASVRILHIAYRSMPLKL